MIRRIEPSASGKNSVFLAQAPRFIWPTACAISAFKFRVFSHAASAPPDNFLPTFEALLQAFEQTGIDALPHVLCVHCHQHDLSRSQTQEVDHPHAAFLASTCCRPAQLTAAPG